MQHNILVIGGGGREHAICHTLKKSKRVGKIYAAPGNAGIAQIAECVNIKATDIDAIAAFVDAHPDIYMTVIGPDDTLALGLTDVLSAKRKKVFGPTAAAAKIEASKVFSKNFMKKYGIPTAAYETFGDYEKAREYLKTAPLPTVIKADGLALGKGVIICNTRKEAEAGLKQIMLDKAFGQAGQSVVIEEFLKGYEVTILSFCDGETLVPMPCSRDYKRALDGDKGLNTGGMGGFSPVLEFEGRLKDKACNEIFMPTVRALSAENRKFKGVLYFDLMVDGDNFKVVEYNARLGDPETQSVLPRLKSDLFEIFDACIDGQLNEIKIEWDKNPRVCVVAASGGYPLEYQKGKEIFIGDLDKDTLIFEAGTAVKDGKKVTNGGRVLSVVCCGKDLQEARDKAYKEIKKIKFDGMFYRKDI